MIAEELVEQIQVAKINEDFELAERLFDKLCEEYLLKKSRIYANVYSKTKRFCSIEEKEDIIQEFLMRVFHKIHHIKFKIEGTSLSGYLNRMFFRLADDYHRKGGKSEQTDDFYEENEGIDNIPDTNDLYAAVDRELSITPYIKELMDGINTLENHKAIEHKILAFHKIRIIDRLYGERDKTDSNDLKLVQKFSDIPLVTLNEMCEPEYRLFFPVPAQTPQLYYMSSMRTRLENKGIATQTIADHSKPNRLVSNCGDWIKQIHILILKNFDSVFIKCFKEFCIQNDRSHTRRGSEVNDAFDL